jgi:hypothetical protein
MHCHLVLVLVAAPLLLRLLAAPQQVHLLQAWWRESWIGRHPSLAPVQQQQQQQQQQQHEHTQGRCST